MQVVEPRLEQAAEVVERRWEQAAESGRRVGGAARPMVGEPAEPFLKAEEVTPAHPGQDHQADYRLAASAAEWQAYRPDGRRVPRHGSTRSPTTVAS